MKRNSRENLIEYYFMITASARSIEETKKRLKKKGSLSQKGASRAHHANFAFKPKIVDRYPRTNRLNTPLLPWVARAVLPRGVRARTKPPPPKFSTFIGWNDHGVKLYGACLLVFDKLNVPNQQENVYIPKGFGFLSHYPLFYAFEVFLRCLWHSIPRKIISLEELLLHYFYDIPAPPLGKKIAYDLGRMKVLLTRRSVYDLPVLELPVETLFQRLSVDNIILLLKLLLLESRIILVSSQETELSQVTAMELTAVAETLISFLYPLKWNHLYIPLISKTVGERLIEYSEPFLVGIPAYLRNREEFSRLPRRAVIVDLEKNEIRTATTDVLITDKCPAWPAGRQGKIKKVLEYSAGVFTNENRTRHQTYNCIKKIFNFMTRIIRLAQDGRSRLQMSSQADSQFCKRLRETHMFKDFCLWYHETRDNKDPKLLNVWKFFIDHEELGQEFAKPIKTKISNIKFDIKEYDEPFKMVNEVQIRQKEKTKHSRLTGVTNIKYDRRKWKVPNIPDISSEAQKFIKQHMLATRMDGRRYVKRRKIESSRARVVSRASNKPASSSGKSSKKNRSRHSHRQLLNPPKPLDLFETDAKNALYVSNWLQTVLNRLIQTGEGRRIGEQKNTKNWEIIFAIRDLIAQLDSVQRSRGSSGTRHKLLQKAYSTVKMAKEDLINVERAIWEIRSYLSCLCNEDESSEGSVFAEMDNLTDVQIQRLVDGEDLSDEDYEEHKDFNDESIDEDWGSEFFDNDELRRSSDDRVLQELDDQIGVKMAEKNTLGQGFSVQKRPSDAHMTELPDDFNENFDTNNDRQYKPLDEFSISQDEKKYWRKVEAGNFKNVGGNQVLIPVSVDYFSDSTLKEWENRVV